jgi:hypothetical protein
MLVISKSTYKYLLFLLVFVLMQSKAVSQINASIEGLSIPELRISPSLSKHYIFPINSYKPVFRTAEASVLYLKRPKLDLPNDYYQHLGFFCKVELKMERQAKIPVRFRLGTTDYVDQLEGK